MKAARKLRRLQHPQSLMEHLRQFLTPQVWKQARQAVPRGRSLPRWDLQPLVIIMLALTWAAGDSQEEKFETARVLRGVSRGPQTSRQDRAGISEGSQSRAHAQLKALAAGVRHQIRLRFAERLLVDGFEPMGCDGSRIGHGSRTPVFG